MAFISKFNHDIFISYAHVDNDDKWVEYFYNDLVAKLTKRIGRKDSIGVWYDARLDGSMVFDEVIEQGINGSAIFIAIHSMGYVASEYCQKELQTFYNKASTEPGGLKVGQRFRIINVLINNIPHKNWASQFAGISGFKFYESKGREDLGDPLNIKSEQFEIAMRDLRNVIYSMMMEMVAPPPPPPTAPPPPPSSPPEDKKLNVRKNALITGILACVFIIAVYSYHQINTHPDSGVKSVPSKNTGDQKTHDQITRDTIREALLKIKDLEPVSTPLYAHIIDSIAARYFVPKFNIYVSYDADNSVAAQPVPDGREYLTILASSRDINDVKITDIKLDKSGKVSSLNIIEIEKKAN